MRQHDSILRMPHLGAIVFDLDGTLVDSYEPITDALNAARRDCGLAPVPLARVKREVGHGLANLVERHLGRERLQRGIEIFRATYSDVLEHRTRAMPGARRVLTELHETGYAIGIASNKPAVFSERIVRCLGLSAAVRAVLGPDESIPPKPEPTMITRVRELLGAPAARCCYVGDMPLDLESGTAAGVETWLVIGGSATVSELLACPGARVIPRLTALPHLLAHDPRRASGIPH
ncbi:MAG: HAD family hydrolase [Acidobacteriota bacterium]|nr:MAG: HAD family hydrolase [Acidobacteriota bacterium]